jgi:hypothetical protein
LQAFIGIEKSQLTHRRLCESKSHASDSHSAGEAAIFRGALKIEGEREFDRSLDWQVPGPSHEIKHDGYRLMARRDPVGIP